MKRSEMLSRIADVIHEHRRATQAYTSEDLAVMVLRMQEDIGMLPPPRIEKDPGHFFGDAFEYEVNEWEDEA